MMHNYTFYMTGKKYREGYDRIFRKKVSHAGKKSQELEEVSQVAQEGLLQAKRSPNHKRPSRTKEET